MKSPHYVEKIELVSVSSYNVIGTQEADENEMENLGS